MRRLCLLLAFAPLLASAQSDDPRLAQKVTLRHRFLTLGELGRYVKKTADVDVAVDRAVAERKVTVFCDELPLGEVLERVGELMFVEWEKNDTGYRLILNREIEKEEKSLMARDAEAIRNGVKRYLAKAAALTSSTLDELQAEADALERDLPTLRKDTSETGRAKYAQAFYRFADLRNLRYGRWSWDFGYLAKQIDSQRMDGLLRGESIFASTKARPGLLKMLPEALTQGVAKNVNGGDSDGDELLVSVRFDVGRSSLDMYARPLGASHGAQAINNRADIASDPFVLAELEKEPLIKRLLEWAKIEDPAVMEVNLSRDAQLPIAGPERVWTLADNLQWLHDRTGVPIVADAFRLYASFDAPAGGTDIGTWLKAFNREQYGQVVWAPARVRTDKGWLMMRHRRFWRHLPQEIPESLLSPLEAKVGAKKDLTVDDYAKLAGALTPAQEAGLRNEALIVAFSAQPLYRKVPILRLWNALSSSQRKTSTAGLPLTAMTPAQVSLYGNVLRDSLWSSLLDESILPHFLPGGPPLPGRLALFYSDSSDGVTEVIALDNAAWDRDGETILRQVVPFEGAKFTLGLDRGSTLQFSVPLRPKRRG